MRYIICLLFLNSITLAWSTERPVASKLIETRVFLSGAQITRSASTTVPSGTGTLIFSGLAHDIDPQSLQVTGKGAFTILGVQHRINYLNETPATKELDDLNSQIKSLEKQLAQENMMKQVLEQEEQLLLKNTSIAGQEQGVNAAQLKAVNDYVRERLLAVKTAWLVQQQKIETLNEQLAKIRQQTQQLHGAKAVPVSEVVVEVSSISEVAATFELVYFVNNAGWTPAYDLRATSVGKPMELLMKARITNNTGEDWNKVKMSLSSGNPTLGGVMPALRTWLLHRYRPVPMDLHHSPNRPAAAMEGSQSRSDKYQEMDATTTLVNSVAHRTTTVEYMVEMPFTVPSDGRPHMIGVQTHEIAATYKHFVTPKLDTDAFLYARTTGWEDLALLPGEANIFFEGTYVGKSFLQLDTPADTLEISLGRDKGIVVERARRKGSDERTLLGSNRVITVGWDITVRNSKTVPVQLEIRDQFPLSPQGEVQVKLEEKNGATVDDRTGMLTWNITVEPRATDKMGFTYTVKHPKDMPLAME